jgi:hypothetical protein
LCAAKIKAFRAGARLRLPETAKTASEKGKKRTGNKPENKDPVKDYDQDDQSSQDKDEDRPGWNRTTPGSF